MDEPNPDAMDVLTVRVPKPQRKRLEAKAVELDRSMAWCIRAGIDLLLEQNDVPHMHGVVNHRGPAPGGLFGPCPCSLGKDHYDLPPSNGAARR